MPSLISSRFAAIVLLTAAVQPALADRLIERYSARLSAQDHFNSNGERLSSPAAIIRQDRANYHKFGKRDDEDEDDNYFAEASNRALLEKLIARGRTTKSAAHSVVNGTPVIEVQIYRAKGGDDYVDVTVFSD
ncbi:MAG: hypothetical protein U1F68_16270 [Gammaproteobacteria bacterium]